MKQGNGEAPKINIMSSSDRPDSRKRDRQSSSERPSPGTATQTPELWEDRILSDVFRVTLDSEHQKDIHGHRLRFLQDTKQDMVESGQSDADIRLSTAVLDQVIVEAASNLGKNVRPLDYLLGCWKRVTREYKHLRRGGERDNGPRLLVIKEARRLCMSYCIFAITIPDMFEPEPPATNTLASHLLLDPGDEKGLDYDFYEEVVTRFPEDESIEAAFVTALEELSKQLATMCMNDDYKRYIAVRICFHHWDLQLMYTGVKKYGSISRIGKSDCTL